MATKFSIAIKVKNEAIEEVFTVTRKDAQKAIDTFKKWRDEGAECYLFNAPEADKRSKGNATVEAPVVSVAPVVSAVKAVVNGFTKQKPKAVVASLDIE
jgi:hypothetical protein